VFAAIQQAIGDGSSASLTYLSFKLDHGIGRKAIPRALKLLDHLVLIEIEVRPRCSRVYRFSNRWRGIDEAEAARLSALARGAKPPRVAAQKPPKPIKQPKPPKVARPSTTPRPVTLAKLAFMDEAGRSTHGVAG
jgi:hypothetical protein